MSTVAERPHPERPKDLRWLPIAIAAGFCALAASDWMQDHFRRLPAIGNERITQHVGCDEAVNPRLLAEHIARAQTYDSDSWEYAVNLGYGYALDSFSSVNLEFLAQADA